MSPAQISQLWTMPNAISHSMRRQYKSADRTLLSRAAARSMKITMPAPNIAEKSPRILPWKNPVNGECGEIGRVVAAPEIRVLVGGARQPEVHDVHEQDPKQGCAPQHVQCEQAILVATGAYNVA